MRGDIKGHEAERAARNMEETRGGCKEKRPQVIGLRGESTRRGRRMIAIVEERLRASGEFWPPAVRPSHTSQGDETFAPYSERVTVK